MTDWGTRGRGFAAGVAASLLLLIVPANASAATTLGQTFPPSPSMLCAEGLRAQTTSAGLPYAAASSGVITSWSFHAAATNVPTQLTFKAVRLGAASTYTVVGASTAPSVAPSSLNTYPTRIPVQAGDVIALQAANTWTCEREVTGFAAGYEFTPLQPQGGTFDGTLTNSQLNVAAQLEPDIDGDGFGDETQDDVAAPETTLTDQPKRKVKTKRKKVKVAFAFSSEAGATFSCTLDGKAAPCTSPFKAKVKTGKHSFSVIATDAAGNADATPATASFKVKRKRR